MIKVLGILCLVFVVGGCAAIQPPGTQAVGAQLKKQPQKCEKETKETFRRLTDAWARGDLRELRQWDSRGLIKVEKPGRPAGELDLLVEAIWIRADNIMLRVSWHEAAEQSTGPETTRHMADFLFKAASPVTLEAVEGENPFDRVAQIGQRNR